MTGPAKFAWIIAILCMGNSLCIPADAAAPRDAIRKLPTITSTSRWVTQNDNEELFSTTWDVRWNSENIPVGTFNTSLSFNYRLNLQDNQIADQNLTRNTRGDSYTFRIDLNKPGFLKSNYQFQHIESSTAENPSAVGRTQNLRNVKTAYLELTPKDAPRFTMTSSETSNVNYNGFNLNRGNDDIYWKGFADLKGRTAQGGYQVHFTNESRLLRNLTGPDRSSTSIGKYQLLGSRDMQIGNMGRLNMQVNYLEDSQRNELQAQQRTTTALDYTLNFGGSIPNYPLTYEYGFKVRYDGQLDGPSNRRSERNVKLGFRPPMPEGRRLSIVYLNNLLDFDNPSNDTSITVQNLRFEFSPNKRTQAGLLYNLRQEFNNITNRMTRDFTELEGTLDYTMPGNRTRYHLGMRQQQLIGQNRIDPQEYTKYTYRASSELGGKEFSARNRRAALSMEISQAYDDKYNAGTKIATPSDILNTRVTYDFNTQIHGGAGGSFNMRAVWDRNLFRRELTSHKNDKHNLRLNFSYITNANWQYELLLQSSEGWGYNGGNEFTENHSNSDLIEAKVKHTF